MTFDIDRRMVGGVDADLDAAPDNRQVQAVTAIVNRHPQRAKAFRPHWIEDDKTRAAFWAYWSKQSLSQADIHTALGVEHVNEFKGTKADAIAKINAWVAAKAA